MRDHLPAICCLCQIIQQCPDVRRFDPIQETGLGVSEPYCIQSRKEILAGDEQ